VDGIQRKSFGQLLVEKGWVSQAQLKEAQEKQLPGEDLFPGTLVRLGLVAEERGLYPLWADHLNVEYLDLKTFPVDRNVLPRLPATIVTHYKVFPVRYDPAAGILTVATAYPQNIFMLDGLQMVHPGRIKAVLSREADILEAIREYYGVGADTIAKMNDALPGDSNPAGEVEDIEQIDSDASIGKFINQILFEAYRTRATDIHIEPYEQDLKIRCRIDGVLYDTQVPTNIWNFKEAINSRIKIMSNLNIAEKRLPQDGRFKVKVGGMSLDLRVSFLPTQYGESVVIRILSSNRLYNMYELGLNAREQELLEHLIQKPHGIVFVTGPTGSGKTTTLYSCLKALNTIDTKIITTENPVEYDIDGLIQVQIRPEIGLTFARCLRSILRQDPDICMVGEVRDLETAEISIQASLTGHLVFTTLHTNDAPSTIARLLDLGLETFLVTATMEGIVAQRLVRKICNHCKTEYTPSEEQLMELELTHEDIKGKKLYYGRGCENCNNTGYRGRTGIYEIMIFNDEIRDLIMNHASTSVLREAARRAGMKTLRENGLALIYDGITTIDEVGRETIAAEE